MQILIFKNGAQQGPYSLEDVRRFRAEGRLLDSDHAWYEGLAEWIPLKQVPGISGPPPPPGSILTPLVPLPAPAGGNGLLLVKRLATAAVVFCVSIAVFFVVIYIVAMMVGGAISGVQSSTVNHPQGFQQGYAVGQEAGRRFAATYGALIAQLSGVLAFICALGFAIWLSFSDYLPWCRRR
jgi:hypothetical protein